MPGFFSSLQDKAQKKLDESGLVSKLPPSLQAHAHTHTYKANQPLDAYGNPVGGTAADKMDVPDRADTHQGAPPAAGYGVRPVGGAYAAAAPPPATTGAGGGGMKGMLMENLSHQIGALRNQYAPQGPPNVRHLQVLITNAKGVSLDYQSVGKDCQALSKDFFLWGQEQDEDIKDVSDRLAYLSFIQGQLSTTLAAQLDEARVPLKRLRDSTASYAPRQAQKAQLDAQIRDLQTRGAGGGGPGGAQAGGLGAKLAELMENRRKHEVDDAPLEQELKDLKRNAVRESEEAKWKAVQEYAEKLLLVTQTASQLIAQLPAPTPYVPGAQPTPAAPYKGHQATAQARSTLQSALDNYSLGSVVRLGDIPASNIDTRSFGESHAHELSRVPSMSSQINEQGNIGQGYGGQQVPSAYGQHQTHPHPLDPSQLNNLPATIPASPRAGSQPLSGATGASLSYTPVSSASLGAEQSVTLTQGPAPVNPTVAETGVPISAGVGGPGPASGSLAGGHRSEPAPGYDVAPGGGIGGFGPPGAGGVTGAPGSGPAGGVGGFKTDSVPGYGDGSAEAEKERLRTTYGVGSNTIPASQAQETPDEARQRRMREEREAFAVQYEGKSPTSAGPTSAAPTYSSPTTATGSTSAYQAPAGAPAPYESAEEEKKRLEREDREKLLRSGGSGGGGAGPNNQGDQGAPPSYQ